MIRNFCIHSILKTVFKTIRIFEIDEYIYDLKKGFESIVVGVS